jgi:hypothetical protein
MNDLIVKHEENDGFSAFARIAQQENRGQILKFGKSGNWTAGVDDDPMDGAELLADVANLGVGWRKWVDGAITNTDLGLIAQNFRPKERHELDDTNESQWPLDNSGKRKDPWQFSYILRLVGEDGTSYVYSASSFGGKAAIGDLCTHYHRKKANPYVKLTQSSYKHKLYGKTFNPKLVVVGFDGEEPAKPAVTTKAPMTITSGAAPKSTIVPFDDPVPFAPEWR